MSPSDPLGQLSLFPENDQLTFLSPNLSAQIVNVASVPQRSPFRYPGGKTWLVPRLREWLRSLPSKPKEFVEPFAGGGIISLTVAFERLADKVVMVELDDEIAAVWKVILEGDGEWLAEKIMAFNMSFEAVQEELGKPTRSLRQKAFRTLLRNRVNHGGILAPGSGVIKKGENGKGILSRWYPETLARRIRAIMTVRNRIKFSEGDGIAVLKKKTAKTDTVYFIDPPYTAAGKRAGTRLYKHNSLDHDELFRVARELKGDFLMTYDNADGVLQLAQKYGFATKPIPMKNTHHEELNELLIGRSMKWAIGVQL